MSFWAEQVAPRLTDRMNPPAVRELRAQACTGLTGHVLEIGFGSGSNLPHYPSTVTAVTAVEPSRVARHLAAPRIAASPVEVRFEGADGAALPFADGSFDAALSTLTLCTIADVHRAVREILRVLKPGAILHFVEHGRAPDPGVLAWQARLEPLQGKVFAGCHLTRDPAALLLGAGFEMADLQAGYLPGPKASRPWAYVSRGRARRPGAGTPVRT